MAATTPLQGFPIPSLTDVPNAPAQLQALGNAIEKQVVLAFPDLTTRNATITSPEDGMVCWVGGTRNTMMQYHDGTWWPFVRYVQGGGIGTGPPPNLGQEMVRVANYGEANPGSDGKFLISFPAGYSTLVSFQITPANRGIPNLAVGWIPVIQSNASSGSGARIQARDFDGTVITARFVGYTYEAVLQ